MGKVRRGTKLDEFKRELNHGLDTLKSAVMEAADLGIHHTRAGMDLFIARLAEECCRGKTELDLHAMLYVTVGVADALGLEHEAVHDALEAVCRDRHEKRQQPLS